MRNLFLFLFRFRAILVFSLLEIISLSLFITNNSYQRAAFFNSANAYAGTILARRTQVTDYFHLVELNKQLAAENAALRQQLYPPDTAGRVADSVALPPAAGDSLRRIRYAKRNSRPDTLLLGQQQLPARDPAYPLIAARVLNNSTERVDNFLTLNAGMANGVQVGQGVVAAGGVVGRVQKVSPHYATVASLLHSLTRVSAKIKRDGTFGTVTWPGDDPTHARLDNVLRETRLLRGDTIVTWGFSTSRTEGVSFPEGVFIGTIDSFVKEPDKNFWTVRLKLGVNFSNLSYVYVVTPRPQAERDTMTVRPGQKAEARP